MAEIVFLDPRSAYDGATLRAGPLGGTQSNTVYLAEALVRRGHRVSGYTSMAQASDYEGVSWQPIAAARGRRADLIIANNVASPFGQAGSGTRVIWFHNRTNFSRMLRKGALLPMVQYRPHGVFLSDYHRRETHGLIPLRSRRIIQHGVDPDMWRRDEASAAPPPRALFISQPYRGLEWLADLWAEQIHPAMPEAELHVFTPSSAARPDWLEERAGQGIRVRGGVNKLDLAREIQAARVLLYPGHADETYCNAAAEATAGGLPIVTRGLGSLTERVKEGCTGFITPDTDDFAAAALKLLRDDALWQRQHRAALADASIGSWDDRAGEWEAAFLGQNGAQLTAV